MKDPAAREVIIPEIAFLSSLGELISDSKSEVNTAPHGVERANMRNIILDCVNDSCFDCVSVNNNPASASDSNILWMMIAKTTES